MPEVGGGEGHGSPFGHLADRIEENLSSLLVRAEDLLRENERHVLAVAHALEAHKTLSGEDIEAVIEGQRGPLVDGTVYSDAFITKLREYHVAALRAHQSHSNPEVPLPVPAAPAYAIADSYGTSSLFDGSFGGNGNGAVTEAEDVIDFGGLGTGSNGSNGSNGNGAHGGPLSAPTYDPPSAEDE
jgi:cell division protease FtsH